MYNPYVADDGDVLDLTRLAGGPRASLFGELARLFGKVKSNCLEVQMRLTRRQYSVASRALRRVCNHLSEALDLAGQVMDLPGDQGEGASPSPAA